MAQNSEYLFKNKILQITSDDSSLCLATSSDVLKLAGK